MSFNNRELKVLPEGVSELLMIILVTRGLLNNGATKIIFEIARCIHAEA